MANSKMTIAGLAASAVDYILREMGVTTLLSGSLVLGNDFGVSFQPSPPNASNSYRAAVPIGKLKAAEMFRELQSAGIDDPMLFEMFVDDLVYAAVREFEIQSPEFGKLPT